MRHRHQEGHIYRKGHSWFVRYYDDVVQDNGTVVRKLVARRIASVRDFLSKAEVRVLADELLAPINSGFASPAGTMTLSQFVDGIYLPFVAEQRRPSTAAGYRDTWRKHLRGRCGTIRLRDFRTWHGEQLMHQIARQCQLSRTTLKHIKALLSGVFKHAKRQGFIDGVNPMQDVSIPRGSEPKETYAYSLEEVIRMLTVLPDEAAVVVAAAAFTGVRRGELRGLLWENYDGVQIAVTQSVWRNHVTEPKTRKSKSPVPVIKPLAELIGRHRKACGNPDRGLMFRSRTGGSLDLSELARRVIRPALEAAGLEWHGWHSFRRGLATNLYRLGVSDKTIQQILRHSNVSTTMNSYVKAVPADTAAAMNALELICTQYAPADSSGRTPVM